ncbi:MAG: SRPBCC domain-containing protein [Myxococcales bacterium]
MATETVLVSAFIAAPPRKVYSAWLSAKEHAAFTGAEATGDERVGGKFTAWDGYISGTNKELLEGRLIVQAWRTTDFDKRDPDSVLTVHFDPDKGGTHVTILHTEIPEGQGVGYQQGWFDYYFDPLRKYFGKGGAKAKKVAAKKSASNVKAKPAKKVKAPAAKKAAVKKGKK